MGGRKGGGFSVARTEWDTIMGWRDGKRKGGATLALALKDREDEKRKAMGGNWIPFWRKEFKIEGEVGGTER